MPAYEIVIHCKDCGGEHPILMRIHLDGGPDGKRSIAELFRDSDIPPQVAAVRGHKVLCLRTGRHFKIENDADIFLVPSSSIRRDSFS